MTEDPERYFSLILTTDVPEQSANAMNLSMEALEEIEGARGNKREQLRLLKVALDVEETYRFDAWTSIVTDFLMYVLAFAEEQNFPTAKKAEIFAIMKSVFDDTFGEKSREESYDHFKALVLKSVDETIFDVTDIKPLADFISTTFFRHFHAYRTCFHHKQPLDSFSRTLAVDTPLRPPPLATGVLRPEEEAASPAPAPASSGDDLLEINGEPPSEEIPA